MSALTIIKYPGGKAQHVRRMLRYLPPFEPRVIVDAFCGSCAFGVAAAEQYPNAKLVLNDTNADLVNALIQIRDHADELAEELRLTPYSRSLFVGLKDGRDESRPYDDLARARDWIIRNRQSVGGCLSHSGTGWSRDQECKKVTQWAKLPDQLREFAARMVGRSYIESQDFGELLFGARGQMFGWDAPDAWTYFDPPYPGREHYYGDGKGVINHAPTGEGLHERVARVANACRGAVLISYADTPEFEEYRGLYDGWRIERFEAVQHMRVRREGQSKGTRIELLLMNYEPHAEQRRLRLITQEEEMSETAVETMIEDVAGAEDQIEDEEAERQPDGTVCGITDPIAELDAIGEDMVALWKRMECANDVPCDDARALALRLFLVVEEIKASGVGGVDAMDAAEAAVDSKPWDERSRTAEMRIWTAAQEHAALQMLLEVDGLRHSMGYTDGLKGQFSARYTVLVDDGKLKFSCDVGEIEIRVRTGERTSLSMDAKTVAAMRRRAFQEHTQRQLELLELGMSEAEMDQAISAALSDDECTVSVEGLADAVAALGGADDDN